MSLFVQLIIAAALFASGLVTGIKWQIGIVAARDLAAQNAAIGDKIRRDEKIDTAAIKHEAFKTRIEYRDREIEKEVTRVIQNPVYTNVCLADDGLRIINDAIKGIDAASEPAPALRKPAGTGGGKWSDSAAVDSAGGEAVPGLPEPAR